ncbi:MAG TPA: glycosyltransferase family 4 protein [Chloroflexia bacterium]|nr:glycosyltransferase family 4 protein [Chloroflexia bacterium]
MKICLVSPYDFAREGGVNQHIMALAEEFRSQGHVVKIMAPSSADESDTLQADPNIYRVGNVVPIKANGSVARITLSLNLAGQIKRILQEEQFDVVHIHEPLMPALPLTVLAYSKALNIGTFHAFSQSNIGYYYGRPVLRYFVRRLDGRIAVSRPAMDFISQYFPGYYRIIPNPIDLNRFKADAEPLPEFNDGKLNILFVGRFGERRKGFKYLLRAFNYVRQQVPDVRLIIVGKGETKGYQRYLRNNNITDVIFTGFVPDEMLPRYYSSAHVFCAPSIGGESFGIVLVEAMASGLPIVASDIPGYASVLEHGKQGLLVEPKNTEMLAMSLIRLLADADLRTKMGQAGRAKVGEYSWKKVAQRVLEFYARSENRRLAKLRLKRMRLNRRTRTYGLGWLRKRRYAGEISEINSLSSRAEDAQFGASNIKRS